MTPGKVILYYRKENPLIFFVLLISPMKSEKAEILYISTPDSNLKSQIHSLIFMRIRIGGLDLNRC